MPTALITGTSTGIGLETALHFARNGYRVFAGARKPEVVERHPNIVPVKLDVDQDASVRDCVAEVLRESPIDVLINNAGIGIAGAIELLPFETVRALFETNFFGAVRMMQAVLPSMRARRGGTIVNVTSMMDRITLPCHGFYAASKFALAAASEALAIEALPFGIKVAIIEPGVILTPIWTKAETPAPGDYLYQQGMSRLLRVFGAQLEGGTMPDVVARAIYDAVQEGAIKLRYPVGADAEVLAATHARLSPAEWVALFTEEDEDEFVRKAEVAFGVDLCNPPSLNQRLNQGLNRGLDNSATAA
ncbi:MAG: SDR family NAD(P)-dependent oxidoreductase [Terriglobales bacterium]|jgi:NAD(P)-dependent dehydrogenase (short-subunit alcohol dehydrogenase family)